VPKKKRLSEAQKRPVQRRPVGIMERIHTPYTSKINLRFLSEAKRFFREVRIELKKVTWPSRKETIATTSVVIILVLLVAAFLGLTDLVLSRLVGYVMH
jgi:preprotein translocase SecE subunit